MGDEHLSKEFATTWRTYDLDEKTRSLLAYVDTLREAGWSEDAIYEATALISFFNFSGRLEAASGLPPDEVPAGAITPEAQAE